MKRYLTAAALVLLPLFVLPGLQASTQPSLAALAEEFATRHESLLDDYTDRPLVDEAPRSLSIHAAQEHGRWAEGLLDRLAAIESDGLSGDEWITWAVLQWEAEDAAPLTRSPGRQDRERVRAIQYREPWRLPEGARRPHVATGTFQGQSSKTGGPGRKSEIRKSSCDNS